MWPCCKLQVLLALPVLALVVLALPEAFFFSVSGFSKSLKSSPKMRNGSLGSLGRHDAPEG
jgi:hypothetical protein